MFYSWLRISDFGFITCKFSKLSKKTLDLGGKYLKPKINGKHNAFKFMVASSMFDKSIQGISSQNGNVFGFQGHPEASPGPKDIQSLFDKFIFNIKKFKEKN